MLLGQRIHRKLTTGAKFGKAKCSLFKLVIYLFTESAESLNLLITIILLNERRKIATIISRVHNIRGGVSHFSIACIVAYCEGVMQFCNHLQTC